MRQRACKPGSVHRPHGRMGDHSSRPAVAGRLKRPTRAAGGNTPRSRNPSPPLFGLAPGGVCRAAAVTGARGALLPHPFTVALPKHWGRSLTPSALCGTVPNPGTSPGPAGVTRHRRSAEPGLSSACLRTTRPPGPLASSSYSSPVGLGSSSASRIMRHSASTSPSISSGRKRRWNATVAAIGSATS